MSTKLTLSIDKDIIAGAKIYARNRNTSLSSIIENYLISVTKKQKPGEEEISPLVKSLSGILKFDKNNDFKKQYGKFLSKKYK